MPRKEKFLKSDLISGGVEFVRQHGIEQLNVRNLANFIGCSTQPIFRNYSSMEEYKNDLKDIIHEDYKQFIYNNTNKDNYLISICYAYAIYAKKEPNIFRALFITSLAGSRTIDEVLNCSWNKETIEHTMNKYNIEKEKAEELYRDIRFYTHGIASQISCESIILSEDEIYSLINEMVMKLL